MSFREGDQDDPSTGLWSSYEGSDVLSRRPRTRIAYVSSSTYNALTTAKGKDALLRTGEGVDHQERVFAITYKQSPQSTAQVSSSTDSNDFDFANGSQTSSYAAMPNSDVKVDVVRLEIWHRVSDGNHRTLICPMDTEVDPQHVKPYSRYHSRTSALLQVLHSV